MVRACAVLSLLLLSQYWSFAQTSNVEVTDLGQLYQGNWISSRDGGASKCQIIILKNNSRKKTNKTRIDGQVLDLTNDPINAFYIFEGYIIKGNELIVTDTILDNFDLIQVALEDNANFWNRKSVQHAFNGIFRINRKIEEEHNIYIHVLGGSLLEIRLKE